MAGRLMSPWPFDPRVQQGPSPGTPIFRLEIFPHGAPFMPAAYCGPESSLSVPSGMSEQKLTAAIRRNVREEIRVTLGEWNGAPVFGIRAWFKADDGTARPSGDGLTLPANLLPDLARALAEAERIARAEKPIPSGPGEHGGGADE
jgi:hypothetical protein